MADIDVSAVALASPPSAAPPESYTPAVTVRNNGRADALATGYLQVFRKTTGVLVRTFQLASATIHPGSTGAASADGALDLTAEPVGTQFIFNGYVTCAGDMVPSNNALAPVTVTISAVPPPPPPPVAAHVSQHEAGGGDTLSVEGLTGELADAQTAKAHAAEHEETGSDELNVAGLHGELADGQTPKSHATSHEPGGADEISGIAAAIHDNERHSEVYITADALPTAGAAQRLLPRVVETVTAAPNQYTDAGFKPNLAGALGFDYPTLELLHEGGEHTLQTTIAVGEANARDFALRFRAGLKVQGNMSLNVEVSAVIDGGGTPVIVAFEELTLAANSTLDAVVVDLLANIHPQTGDELCDMTATGFILYPEGPNTSCQRRVGNWQASDLILAESWTAYVKVKVLNGDNENGLYWYNGIIEHVPSATN